MPMVHVVVPTDANQPPRGGVPEEEMNHGDGGKKRMARLFFFSFRRPPSIDSYKARACMKVVEASSVIDRSWFTSSMIQLQTDDGDGGEWELTVLVPISSFEICRIAVSGRSAPAILDQWPKYRIWYPR